MGSPEVAERLFDEMFTPTLSGQSGYVVVAGKNPITGEFRQVFCEDIAMAAAISTDLFLHGMDTYFAVNPRSRVSRKKDAVNALVTVHADADSLKPESYRKLESLEPSLIVSSGTQHSYHAYLWFRDPLGPDHLKTVELLNRKFHQVLGVDPSPADVSRVLRIPRTLNFKDVSDPRPVNIVSWHPERRYSVEDVAERLGVDLSPSEKASRTLEPPEPTIMTVEEALAPRSRFLDGEQRLYVQRLLHHGLFEPSSRNTAQLLLTMHYFEQGYSSTEIYDLLKAFFQNQNNGLSQDWDKQPRWVLKNIERGIENWTKKAAKMRESLVVTEPQRLGRKDRAFIQKQSLSEGDRRFLYDALEWILNNKRDDRVILSVRQLWKFAKCNERNYQSKRSTLYKLKILELDTKHDRKTGLAFEYRVLYKFQDPQPRRQRKRGVASVAEKIEKMILAGKTNREIRECFPQVSRQRIQSKRNSLDKLSRSSPGIE